MKSKIILIGYFVEVYELAKRNEIEIIGCYDKEKTGLPEGVYYLGDDTNAILNFNKYKKNKIHITPDNPVIREKLFIYYNKIGYNFCNIVSRNAQISESMILGKNILIQDFVNISSEVEIGNFVKINTGSNVMHNVILHDFVTLAPNSVLLGYVEIGKNSYIGANATILPNVKITNNVLIGAGSVVTKSITEPGTYVGIPAKKIKS